MQQFLERWNSLDLRQQVMALVSVAVILGGLTVMIQQITRPQMSLLYSGLSPAASAEIVSMLDAEGASYELQGSSIFVDARARDALRLSLAGQGLPANGGDGYELLDGLSGFGTTSQMFDAAYMRAREGELARTILANPQIKAARVHIAQSERRPFRDAPPASASVSIRTHGQSLSRDGAQAVRHLVAAAVPGLVASEVTIIDADLGQVVELDENKTPDRMALSRSEMLKRNVERLIAARTGSGRSVVEVNVETYGEDELITERRFNPDQRVAISTDTRESSARDENSGSGNVTVASNLPEGEGGNDRQSSSESSDTREIINYEVSQTTRELRRLAGGTKRITVAVLVDGVRETAADGTETFTPRDAEELATLEELVKAAVGFDEARGDAVTLRSMALSDMGLGAETAAEGWVEGSRLNILELARILVPAAVVLALGLFVLRPIFTKPRLNEIAEPAALPAGGIAAEAPDLAPPGLALPALPQPDAPGAVDFAAALPEPGGMASALDDYDGGFEGDDFGGGSPVERLKALIEERQDETVEVLRNWIENSEEPTS